MIAAIVLILAFVSFPVLGIPIATLNICSSKRYKWLFFVFLAYAIAIIGYNFRLQGSGLDLFRHNFTMNQMQNFPTVWSYVLFRHDVFTFLYYYYLKFASFFGENMLPFISTFISMLLLFRIIRISSKAANAGFWAMLTTMLFGCLAINLLVFCSSFRQVIALLFFVNLFLTETQKSSSIAKRLICYFGYFFLIFFHTSVIIIIIMRILVASVQKHPKYVAIFLLFWAALWETIRDFIASLGTAFTNNLVVSMDFYKEYSNTTPLMQLIWIFHICMLVFLLFYIYRSMPKFREMNNEYFKFCMFTVAFGFGSINAYTLFNRMSMLCWLLTVYLLPQVVENMLKKKRNLAVFAINGSTILTFAYYCVSIYFAPDSGIYWTSLEDILSSSVLTIIFGR